MILLLDNYDSFTWNLHHYVTQLSDEQVMVKRNNEITISEVAAYSSIILSPGPGLPDNAGIMPELIQKYGPTIPILGICLGHQAIGEAYGAKLINLEVVLHGVQRDVNIIAPNDRVLKGLPNKIRTGHYHSWVISESEMPGDLQVTARDSYGTVMAISHKEFPVSGVQFHPESVLTDHGMKIIKNWLNFCDSFIAQKSTPAFL
jgi:anthranilate synthase component 2